MEVPPCVALGRTDWAVLTGLYCSCDQAVWDANASCARECDSLREKEHDTKIHVTKPAQSQSKSASAAVAKSSSSAPVAKSTNCCKFGQRTKTCGKRHCKPQHRHKEKQQQPKPVMINVDLEAVGSDSFVCAVCGVDFPSVRALSQHARVGSACHLVRNDTSQSKAARNDTSLSKATSKAPIGKQNTFRVSGAGVASVNGVYSQSNKGTKDEVPYYTNGNTGIILFRYAMPRTRERYWYLAESTMLNSDLGDYYRVKSESALPPCSLVWTIERCPDGVLPSPQVLNIHSEKLNPPAASKPPSANPQSKPPVAIAVPHVQCHRDAHCVRADKHSGHCKHTTTEIQSQLNSQPSTLFTGSSCAGKDVQVGQWLNVWWPKEEVWFSGQVSQFNLQSMQHTVDYLDGDQAHHTMDKEHFKKSSSKSKCLTEAQELTSPEGNATSRKQITQVKKCPHCDRPDTDFASYNSFGSHKSVCKKKLGLLGLLDVAVPQTPISPPVKSIRKVTQAPETSSKVDPAVVPTTARQLANAIAAQAEKPNDSPLPALSRRDAPLVDSIGKKQSAQGVCQIHQALQQQAAVWYQLHRHIAASEEPLRYYPTICYAPLDLAKLWLLVEARGGYKAVCSDQPCLFKDEKGQQVNWSTGGVSEGG